MIVKWIAMTNFETIFIKFQIDEYGIHHAMLLRNLRVRNKKGFVSTVQLDIIATSSDNLEIETILN